MRGQEVILLNFPISHFLKSLAHSAMFDNKPGPIDPSLCQSVVLVNFHFSILVTNHSSHPNPKFNLVGLAGRGLGW